MIFEEFMDKFKDRFIFFDGAMGTMLQKYGLKKGEPPEILNITSGEKIKKIHEAYLEAGADIITTNTFGTSELRCRYLGYSQEEVLEKGIEIAMSAVSGKDDKFVALDIGPIGEAMEPFGDLSFETAYNLFKKQVLVGEREGVDFILIETMMDICEMKAAVLAARENSSIPVFCTMTFQEDGITRSGTDPQTMVFTLESLGADVIGVNCCSGPKKIKKIVDEILKYSSTPVMVQPNAGLPRYDGNRAYYDICPHEFSRYMKIMAQSGVKMLGGCCGTNPKFIKTMRAEIENSF